MNTATATCDRSDMQLMLSDKYKDEELTKTLIREILDLTPEQRKELARCVNFCNYKKTFPQESKKITRGCFTDDFSQICLPDMCCRDLSAYGLAQAKLWLVSLPQAKQLPAS